MSIPEICEVVSDGDCECELCNQHIDETEKRFHVIENGITVIACHKCRYLISLGIVEDALKQALGL